MNKGECLSELESFGRVVANPKHHTAQEVRALVRKNGARMGAIKGFEERSS